MTDKYDVPSGIRILGTDISIRAEKRISDDNRKYERPMNKLYNFFKYDNL